MSDQLLGALELYLRDECPGDVRIGWFIDFVQRDRTRELELWVARRLRAMGYHRAVRRVDGEVVRLWRPPREGANWRALDEPEKAPEIRPVTAVSTWLADMGWSIDRAARELGSTHERIYAWSRGRRAAPRMALLAMTALKSMKEHTVATPITWDIVKGVDNPPAPCSYTLTVDDDESTGDDAHEHPLPPV